ncbi:hypothetical protein [Azotobacter armeniacus]
MSFRFFPHRDQLGKFGSSQERPARRRNELLKVLKDHHQRLTLDDKTFFLNTFAEAAENLTLRGLPHAEAGRNTAETALFPHLPAIATQAESPAPRGLPSFPQNPQSTQFRS